MELCLNVLNDKESAQTPMNFYWCPLRVHWFFAYFLPDFVDLCYTNCVHVSFADTQLYVQHIVTTSTQK